MTRKETEITIKGDQDTTPAEIETQIFDQLVDSGMPVEAAAEVAHDMTERTAAMREEHMARRLSQMAQQDDGSGDELCPTGQKIGPLVLMIGKELMWHRIVLCVLIGIVAGWYVLLGARLWFGLPLL